MRRSYIIFIIIFLTAPSLFAQVEKIKYYYDACGNRTVKILEVEKMTTTVNQIPSILSDSIPKADISISVYPNPTMSSLNIDFSDFSTGETYKLLIIGVQGDLKYSDILKDKKTILDMNAFSPGTYFVKIYNQDRSTYYKVVKN